MTCQTTILRLRSRIFAFCACVYRLSIHDNIYAHRVYDLNKACKEDALAAFEKVRTSGVLGDPADVHEASRALKSSNARETAENTISQILSVYSLFRGRLSEVVNQLIAACGLDAGEVFDRVRTMEQSDSVTTLQKRYLLHVNNTRGTTEESLLKLSARLDSLVEFMWSPTAYGDSRFPCCIPVLREDGTREFHDDWMPQFDITYFLKEWIFIRDCDFCEMAASMLSIIQSVEDELRDIRDELRAWRVLQCAMALHRRVGDASWLGMLGEDVVKMVLKIMLK